MLGANDDVEENGVERADNRGQIPTAPPEVVVFDYYYAQLVV